MPIVDVIPLHQTTRERYLNYALSVITSRALPDIRDGLKPVQRRILYAMHNNLRLYPDGRYRKSATVVGEVMGKYHPHGDSAIYDAMVRMAQDFSLRAPLVDGHGNFGSIDGDSPAAMRYTEAKLQALAMELLDEIRKNTVDFRPNFDGTIFEPVVLPASFPNLLVNGATGIAVGMATNMPPHNLGEVVDALVHLIEHPDATVDQMVPAIVKGPDFPTGGSILNTEAELLEIYRTGEGAVNLRGEFHTESERGKTSIIVHSIPYAVSKGDLIEKIAEHVEKERVPQIVDVRDESTDEIRIVLELRRGADPEAAMAYLFRHTPLQQRFHVNMTCLVPTENPEVGAPRKVNLIEIFRHFLDFRMEVLIRRLRFDLDQLEKRIHILRGFEIIFSALDEAIKLIRASKDKRDAAARLMHRFALDEVQTEAILETKLYKLARLEIESIRKELEEKERMAAELRTLLADEPARWLVVRDELAALRTRFANERRSTIAGPDETVEYVAEDYIVDEDVYVIVTRDGWIKRQRSYTEIGNIRVREGDSVAWVLPGSTRATLGLLTNFGRAYSLRIDQLPSTSGHGDPVQKHFEFSNRERIVGVVSFDERVLPEPAPLPAESPGLFEGDGAPALVETDGPQIVAVTARGQAIRIPASNFAETSTRNGRLFARLRESDEVVAAFVAGGNENACLASKSGHVLIFPVSQIPLVKNAAQGVIGMKLAKDDRIMGFTLSTAAREGLEIETNRGRKEIVRTTKFEVSNRGNKGRCIIKRGTIARVILQPIEIRLNGEKGKKGVEGGE
jgi:DNA gyrase subunit A